MKNKPIIIVAGEPNSIFLEIFFKTIKRKKFKRPLVLICSKKLLKLQMNKLKFKKKVIHHWHVNITTQHHTKKIPVLDRLVKKKIPPLLPYNRSHNNRCPNLYKHGAMANRCSSLRLWNHRIFG